MRNLLAICAAIAVASCSMARDDICTPVPDLSLDIGKPEDFAKNMQDPIWLERRAANCIHRWGYRLAPSKDEGLTVAKAVMQACEGAVADHVNTFATRMADDYQKRYADGVVSLGERNNYYEERRAEKLAQLEREAHFRIQQARAGKCKA